MKPTKCTACQGENLFFGRLRMAVFPAHLYLGRPAPANGAVCLSCGFINAYLSPDQLEKVKVWKSKE
jgi:hypothetical protein